MMQKDAKGNNAFAFLCSSLQMTIVIK